MAQDGDIDLKQIILMIMVVGFGGFITWWATHEAFRARDAEARLHFDYATARLVDRLEVRVNNDLLSARNHHHYYETLTEQPQKDLHLFLSEHEALRKNRYLLSVAMPTSEFLGEKPWGWQRFALNNIWYDDKSAFVVDMAKRLQDSETFQIFLNNVRDEGVTSAIPIALKFQGKKVPVFVFVEPFEKADGQDALFIQVLDAMALVRSIVKMDNLTVLDLHVAASWNGMEVPGVIVSGGGKILGDAHEGTEHLSSAPMLLQIGLMQWQVTTSAPLAAFLAGHRGPVYTAIIGASLTFLLFLAIWLQSQRANKVAEIVNRRTRALKEAHKELEDHYKMLQELNKDVEDARQLAETANRAKSEFLATMSHELRTPLNAILGFSQLLKEQVLGPLGDKRYQDYAGDIHASGSHLLSLINEILDLAKLEAGKINIDRKVVEIGPLMEGVISLLAQQATGKSIGLVSDIAPDMPQYIWGDELRLRQILINLINNAIKFTSKGQVTLRFFCRPYKNGKRGWVIEVEDTGVGIAEDKLPSLFDRFTQVDTALSRKHGGVGLGLAICRELVDRMGGTINVRSAIGVGTTVHVHLPLEEAKIEDDEDCLMI